MPPPRPAPRPARHRIRRLASAAVAVIALACTPQTPPPSQPAPAGAGTPDAGRQPQSAAPADGSAAASAQSRPATPEPPTPESLAPEPSVPGLEPARGAVADPQLAADAAPAGQASARWGTRGPDIDAASPWRSLAGDGIHEAGGDAIGLLQEPRSAFRSLPRSISGDYVDWVAAIDSGAIAPRARVGSPGAMEVLDRDIVLADTRTMPVVSFPHRAHTEWLACGNCHDGLFKAKAGANDISMAEIARGRACGLCHGKVAFPATECFRCHNGPRPKG